MALLSTIQRMLGKKTSTRAETNAQDQARTSEDTYYTASEGSASDDAEASGDTAEQRTSTPGVWQVSADSGKPPLQTAGGRAAGSTALDLKEIGQVLDAMSSQPIAPSSETRQRQFSGGSSGIRRVRNPVQPAEPSLSSVEAPGTYGYRYKERERLARYGHDVSGGSVDEHGNYRSRFESDHIYSFATTHPYPIQRMSKEGKQAADKGMASYELGDLHRNHISSQNTYDVKSGKIKIERADHGWNDPGLFRNHVRGALRDPKTVATGENLSIAGQLHILDYGFMHRRAYEQGSLNGAYPDYATLSAARNSFGFMLKSAPTVHVASNNGSGSLLGTTQQISAKTRAELILARQAAVESEYPSSDDERRVAKALLPKEEYDEKHAVWDADDKALGRLPYDERVRSRGRW